MSVVTSQPSDGKVSKGGNSDNDLDGSEGTGTRRQDYCCCIHGWGPGPDPRWYYPWDKGVYRLMGVCCFMYCACVFVPCLLCKKEFRDIVLCSDQCGDKTRTEHLDDKEDEIAVA